MTIKAKDYRVRTQHKVALDEWPTNVKPVCASPAKYKELLDDHIEKLSTLQRVHYASNRYALLLAFQGMDAAGNWR